MDLYFGWLRNNYYDSSFRALVACLCIAQPQVGGSVAELQQTVRTLEQKLVNLLILIHFHFSMLYSKRRDILPITITLMKMHRIVSEGMKRETSL
jgi:hypothetical protein